jgi:uncharacterized membrane protein YhaH (DUF805 family)
MTKYFSFSNQATRSEFWAVWLIGVFALPIPLVLLSLLSIPLAVVSLSTVPFTLLLLLLGSVGILWLLIATSVRRCRDADINPLWVLAFLLFPYITLIMIVVLGVLPSVDKNPLSNNSI